MAGRPRRFTPEQEAELAARYKAGGISQFDLALENGLSQMGLWKILVRNGWVPSRRSGPGKRPYKAAGTTPKPDVNYRVQNNPSNDGAPLKRCGNCDNRILSAARKRECRVVEGLVEMNGLCDSYREHVVKAREIGRAHV